MNPRQCKKNKHLATTKVIQNGSDQALNIVTICLDHLFSAQFPSSLAVVMGPILAATHPSGHGSPRS